MQFPKSARLRKSREFRRFVGKILTERLVVEYRPSAIPRLGLTVSKKYGNAVERNRFKRLVREAYRHAPLQGFDLNVRPRPTAKGASIKDIVADLHYAECQPKESRPYHRGPSPHPGGSGERQDNSAHCQDQISP